MNKLYEAEITKERIAPWRAQMSVMKNGLHKGIMVIDYFQIINKFTLLDAYPVRNIRSLISNVAMYGVFSMID